MRLRTGNRMSIALRLAGGLVLVAMITDNNLAIAEGKGPLRSR